MQSLNNKLRPKFLKDVVGQKHLIGEGRVLSKIVETKSMFSFILYGLPGIGKTTIASALANELDYKFKILNAVNCSKKDLTDVILESKRFKKVVLLLDEFHRLTKPMQDVLLPEIEYNNIFVIGCTTQNPYHSVAPAIRSRLKIFELKTIEAEEIYDYLKHISSNKDLFTKNIEIADDVFKIISQGASGDLRFAINTLEIIHNLSNDGDAINEEYFFRLNLGNFKSYDKDGDYFYNAISALQKSIRGSDVDASLYYLALLIDSGDLETICRRLSVIAYEDVGLANPSIGSFVHAAIETAKSLGFPEARIPLANIVVQLALSPKSNSAYTAIDAALASVNKYKIEIPNHLKDTHYQGAANLGAGIGYKYPHSYPNNYVKQDYLPKKLLGTKFYHANTNNKNEKNLALYQKFLKTLK
ncbi:MAG: replication-associated recombination protein A [Gemella sp.]|nr:replication-associated recombination protein A [Gemella sp.]